MRHFSLRNYCLTQTSGKNHNSSEEITFWVVVSSDVQFQSSQSSRDWIQRPKLLWRRILVIFQKNLLSASYNYRYQLPVCPSPLLNRTTNPSPHLCCALAHERGTLTWGDTVQVSHFRFT